MSMTSAVTATSGPVAPIEFLQPRVAVSAIGHGSAESTHDGKGSESSVTPGAAGHAAAGSAGDAGGKAAAVNPTFKYDSETRRVVMLMSDGNGAVLVQIPSEQALRQYEQALKRVKESVAATQGVAAGAASSSIPAVSSIEAAAVGVLMPSAGDPSASAAEAAAVLPRPKVAAASSGSVTAGAMTGTSGSGARYNIVV